MPKLADQLEDVLEPVRDLYLSRYFRRLQKWRKIGYHIETEPKIRGLKGQVIRDGVLNLPRRADFGLMGKIGPQYRDIGEICDVLFEPMEFPLGAQAMILINPICWKALQISFDANDSPERLKLVRRWYLDAFQTRRLDEGNDVHGTVHALNGPTFNDDVWNFEIDMGSAPISAFADLLDILVESGVTEITVGNDYALQNISAE